MLKTHATAAASGSAAERFSALLVGLDADDLSRSPDVICGVFSDDLTIGYTNHAWRQFASDNGAQVVWGPGDSLLDALPASLREFYRDHLERVRASGKPWEHDYECSSPSLLREFRLRAVVIGGGAGLLLIHALRFERPHEVGDPFIAAHYVAATGLVLQCAHCKRVRRAEPPWSWDWLPALIPHAEPNVTHGICPSCSAYYFGPELLDQ